MIDITLGGLIGAVVGTLIAAVAFAPAAGAIERALIARRAAEDGPVDHAELALMRRAVFVFDLLLFTGLGYWIGDVVERWAFA